MTPARMRRRPAGDAEEDAGLLRAMLEVSIDDPKDFVSEAEVLATLRDSHRD